MDKGLIEIMSFPTLQQLYIARGILKNNGIESYTDSDLRNYIIETEPLSGFRLYVNREFEKQAIELIKDKIDPESKFENVNYLKELIFTINLFILVGAVLYAFQVISNLYFQFFNYNDNDKFNSILLSVVNLLAIIGGVGGFMRKRWAWFILASYLNFTLIHILLFYKDFGTYVIPFYITIFFLVAILCVIILFYTKPVSAFFRVHWMPSKIILTLLISIILVVSDNLIKITSDNTTVSSFYIDGTFRKRYFNSAEFNGQLLDYYFNGKIMQKGFFVKGLQFGTWDSFYISGKKAICAHYKKGLLNGTYTVWDEKGSKIREGNYKDDDKISNWFEWYPSGQIKLFRQFKNGIFDGLSLGFYPNGNKIFEENYVKGLRNGFYREWFEDGSLKTTGFYKDGMMENYWIDWLHGKKYSEEYYKDGIKDGTASRWDEKGNLIEQGCYKDGGKEGIWNCWDKNGKPFNVKVYHDDEIITTKLLHGNLPITSPLKSSKR